MSCLPQGQLTVPGISNTVDRSSDINPQQTSEGGHILSILLYLREGKRLAQGCLACEKLGWDFELSTGCTQSQHLAGFSEGNRSCSGSHRSRRPWCNRLLRTKKNMKCSLTQRGILWALWSAGESDPACPEEA